MLGFSAPGMVPSHGKGPEVHHPPGLVVLKSLLHQNVDIIVVEKDFLSTL